MKKYTDYHSIQTIHSSVLVQSKTVYHFQQKRLNCHPYQSNKNIFYLNLLKHEDFALNIDSGIFLQEGHKLKLGHTGFYFK